MNIIQKTTIAALASFAAFGAAPASAVTISNPVGGYSFGPLGGSPFTGGSQTEYIGQTFTTPITGQLTNLQFNLLSGSLPFLYSVVYEWNGTAPGTQVWRSANVAATSGLIEFNPTGVTLTQGKTYVAFLSTAGIANNTGSIGVDSCFNAGCTAPDANLGFAVTGTNRSGDVTWSNNFGIYDLKFSATVTAPVPEPATWAMMIGGFGAIGGTMRYRRRKTTVSFA